MHSAGIDLGKTTFHLRRDGRQGSGPLSPRVCCASWSWTRSHRLILNATMPRRSTTCSNFVPLHGT